MKRRRFRHEIQSRRPPHRGGTEGPLPNARCSLEYKKDYELLFAVRLSAQCTDARVNMVTPSLYQKFPTLEAFANATYE